MRDKKKQALASYVENQVESGQDPQSLKEELRKNGWSEEEISAVFSAAGIKQGQQQAAEDKPSQTQTDQSGDPFLHNTPADQQHADQEEN